MSPEYTLKMRSGNHLKYSQDKFNMINAILPIFLRCEYHLFYSNRHIAEQFKNNNRKTVRSGEGISEGLLPGDKLLTEFLKWQSPFSSAKLLMLQSLPHCLVMIRTNKYYTM